MRSDSLEPVSTSFVAATMSDDSGTHARPLRSSESGGSAIAAVPTFSRVPGFPMTRSCAITSGFPARADGRANRIALNGRDNVVGALDVRDVHREDGHHALVSRGAQGGIGDEMNAREQAGERQRRIGGFLPRGVERIIRERDGGP